MLWTPGNQFNWSVDNFGADYTDAAAGVNSPGHASANTKGANTNLLNGIAEDCYGIAIGFVGGFTSATIRRNLVDILIDPAAGVGNAGSAWAIVIPNLYCAYAGMDLCGYWYYFPLYLKTGTAIGSANQSLTGSTSALRVMIRVFGKPTRPEQIRVGSKVETFGAVTGTTTGTAITPGLSVLGSYTASLGTTVNDLWWWQAGLGFDDTSLTGGTAYMLDVAASTDGGTTKLICTENIIISTSASEKLGKSAIGSRLPYREVPAGATIYMRAVTAATPDTTPTCVAYGLGG